MLHSGSVPEGVSAPHIKPGNYDEPLTFSKECDIMAVIKIEDLVQSSFKYQLRVLEEHPCFVSVILFGHTPEVKSSKISTRANPCHTSSSYQPFSDSLSKNLVGQLVISPNLYLKSSERLISTAVESLFEPEKDTFRYGSINWKVSNHGPAVRLQCDSPYSDLTILIYLAENASQAKTASQEEKYNQHAYSEQEGRNSNQNDFDIVPAIKIPTWPEQAAEWTLRERKWPSAEVVDGIISEGVMIVCKTPPGGDPDLHWRLSFSRAEVALLSTPELPCRQHAHKIFKYIIKHVISPPKVLNSYHCKTVMLWASERLPPDSWGWDRLGYVVLGK